MLIFILWISVAAVLAVGSTAYIGYAVVNDDPVEEIAMCVLLSSVWPLLLVFAAVTTPFYLVWLLGRKFRLKDTDA